MAEDKTKESSITGISTELEQKLTAFIDSKAQDGEVLARLTADPDIRALLEARESGKAVRVVVGEEGEKDKKADVKPDLNEMSNTELAEYLKGALLEAIKPVVGDALKPMSGKLDLLEAARKADEQSRFSQEVSDVKKKYPDFEEYRGEMVELDKKNPTLSAEQLYILARLEKGHGLPLDKTASEKPSSAPNRPERTITREIPLPKGRPGFQQLLSEALDKLDITPKE